MVFLFPTQLCLPTVFYKSNQTQHGKYVVRFEWKIKKKIYGEGVKISRCIDYKVTRVTDVSVPQDIRAKSCNSLLRKVYIYQKSMHCVLSDLAVLYS